MKNINLLLNHVMTIIWHGTPMIDNGNYIWVRIPCVKNVISFTMC